MSGGWKSSFKIKLLLGFSAIILFTFSMAGVVSYRMHLRLFEDEVNSQYVNASEQAMVQLSCAFGSSRAASCSIRRSRRT